MHTLTSGPCYLFYIRVPLQDLTRVLQTLVILNGFRELGRLITTNAAYYLTAADVAGDGLIVSRDAALILPLAFNAFMAVVFRLEVSNFDSDGLATATLLAQGLYEIVARITAPERDQWVKGKLRKLRKLCCWRSSKGQRRSTVLVVSSVQVAPSSPGKPSLAKQERQAEEHERLAVLRDFRSRMILVDIFAEYAGILTGTVVLWCGSWNPLAYPFRPFRKYPQLFDEESIALELVSLMAMQLLIEIVTDTVCIVYETRRGLDPLAVWTGLSKKTLLPFVVYAIFFASYGGQVRSILGDRFNACWSRDFCWCINNGLLPGGVREAYCLLVHNATAGLPAA